MGICVSLDTQTHARLDKDPHPAITPSRSDPPRLHPSPHLPNSLMRMSSSTSGAMLPRYTLVVYGSPSSKEPPPLQKCGDHSVGSRATAAHVGGSGESALVKGAPAPRQKCEVTGQARYEGASYSSTGWWWRTPSSWFPSRKHSSRPSSPSALITGQVLHRNVALTQQLHALVTRLLLPALGRGGARGVGFMRSSTAPCNGRC